MNEAGTIKDSVSHLVDQGHQTVDAIKSRVADVRGQVTDNTGAIRDGLARYVEAHPLKALGIAFGLGYVAMRIRTSFIMELAFLGAFAYGVDRVLRKRAPETGGMGRAESGAV